MFEIKNIDSWVNKSIEPVGGKAKAWYLQTNSSNTPYLFKEAKIGTGEDWSEKVAETIAKQLGLPCAEYELAVRNGRRGVISPSFVPLGASLINGIEFMDVFDPEYVSKSFFKRFCHTLDNVLLVIGASTVFPPLSFLDSELTSGDVFVGYLMLDALIGNGDRHDENWALLFIPRGYSNLGAGLYLAPTYDHAACLGRELPDITKRARLSARDRNQTVSAYLDRNRSAFFEQETDKKTMSTLDAFARLSRRYPAGFEHWRRQLSNLVDDELISCLDSVPESLISQDSVNFGKAMLLEAKKRILEVNIRQ